MASLTFWLVSVTPPAPGLGEPGGLAGGARVRAPDRAGQPAGLPGRSVPQRVRAGEDQAGDPGEVLVGQADRLHGDGRAGRHRRVLRGGLRRPGLRTGVDQLHHHRLRLQGGDRGRAAAAHLRGHPGGEEARAGVSGPIRLAPAGPPAAAGGGRRRVRPGRGLLPGSAGSGRGGDLHPGGGPGHDSRRRASHPRAVERRPARPDRHRGGRSPRRGATDAGLLRGGRRGGSHRRSGGGRRHRDRGPDRNALALLERPTRRLRRGSNSPSSPKLGPSPPR